MGYSPLINKPAVAFPPPPFRLLSVSSFLTNPSFQEQGSCSVLGTCQWSGVCWLLQWLSLSGDNGIVAPRGRVLHAEFPCLIHSCALAPSQQRKGTKLPGRLWQAVPLSAGQKLIPSSSPVPPTEGGRSGQPGFLCKSVRWCEGERADERRVVHHPCSSADRRMDSCCPAV